MKKVILALVLLLLAAGAYYYYQHLTTGPEYALVQAAKATQEHDMATFERYVDVNSVTGNLVDDAAQGQKNSLLMQGAMGIFKPQIQRLAHSQIQQYVETGKVQVQASPAMQRALGGSVLALAGGVLGGKGQFRGIRFSRTDGPQALVGLAFYQPELDTTLVVEVLLRQQPDAHWQVKEIANAQALLSTATRRATNRL